MTAESVVHAEALGKCYHIYNKPRDRLKQSFAFGSRRYYREFWALRNVSFEVNKGESIGIMGRNASGKSTLLQIIAGTLTPTTGSLKVNGRVAALLELGSGFNSEFTGRENIYMNGAVMGLTRAQMNDRYDDICSFADIGDFVDQPVKVYSSGMLLRLAFAIAMHVDASLLIIDEALAVGDAQFQRKCFQRISRFVEQGNTLIFVSHDSTAVTQLCSRAIILSNGEVYDSGEPQRIVRVYHRLLFDKPTPEQPTAETVQPAARENTETDNEEELRYGDKKARIHEAGIRDEHGRTCSVIQAMRPCQLFFKAEFLEDTQDESAFGFIITNVRGIEIYGISSILRNIVVPPHARGSRIEGVARLDMNLVPGDYFLTVCVAPKDARDEQAVFHDLRFDCLHFRVEGLTKCFTTSVVDLNAELVLVDDD